MHQRAKVWAKDQGTKWTTRFRSLAPRKKERKITLARSQRTGIAATSASWFRRVLGLDREDSAARRVFDCLPFVEHHERWPWRVVRPNTRAGAGAGGLGPRQRFVNNKIHTHKYGPFSFLPLNLYEQFKRLANLWFLIIAILHVRLFLFCLFSFVFSCLVLSSRLPMQLIPEISSLNPAASLIPLIFVLSVTAIKEAVEDVVRFLA